MTVAALLFTLALVAISLVLIVDNLLHLSFTWQDLIFFAILAAISFITVRAVGIALDKQFVRSVSEFIEGRRARLLDDKGLLRVFGLLLLTLLPFLIFLQLLAVYAAVIFAALGFLFLSMFEAVPIVLVGALVIVVLGTAVAVPIGWFRLLFPKNLPPVGLPLQSDEEYRLWQLTDDVADRLSTRAIDQIIVTPEPGIGVTADGSLFSRLTGRADRVLIVGLPSIRGLTVGEFKAVVAHEYGHFSNTDTRWGSFTHAMSSSLLTTVASTPGPFSGGGIVGFVAFVNPAWWLLSLFVALFVRVTSGFSRVREVLADVRAIDLYGGEALSAGLRKIAANESLYHHFGHERWMAALFDERKPVRHVLGFLEDVYSSLEPDAFERGRDELAKTKATPYDSHPSLTFRLDYAARFTGRGEYDARPFPSLFDRWDDLNAEVADEFNRQYLD